MRQGESFEGSLVVWNRTNETVPYQEHMCETYAGLYQNGSRKGGQAGHITCTAMAPPPAPFAPGERREFAIKLDTWDGCELMPPGRYPAGAAPDGQNEGHDKYWFAPGVEVTIEATGDPPSSHPRCE